MRTLAGNGARDAKEGVEGIDSRVKESEFLFIFFHNDCLFYAISLIIRLIPFWIMSWISFFDGSTNSHRARSSGRTS